MPETVCTDRDRRVRRNVRRDLGLAVKITETGEPEASLPALDRALRTLARMLVRAHRAEGEGVANPRESRSSSALTVSPNPRPDQRDDAA